MSYTYHIPIALVLVCLQFVSSNWHHASIDVTANCPGCYYVFDLYGANKDGKLHKIETKYGRVDVNNREFYSANALVKKTNGAYANVYGCVWTTPVYSHKDCQKKLNRLEHDLSEVKNGRRLDIDTNQSHRKLWFGALIRLLAKLIRVLVRVIVKAIRKAPKIIPHLRKLTKLKAFRRAKVLFNLGEAGLTGYTVAEAIQLSKNSAEIRAMNEELSKLANKKIGFFTTSHRMTCDGTPKSDSKEYHVFSYQCSGNNFDEDFDF